MDRSALLEPMEGTIMAKDEEYLYLTAEDDPDFNLFLYQLMKLSDDMHIAGDPFARRLEEALLRFYSKAGSQEATDALKELRGDGGAPSD